MELGGLSAINFASELVGMGLGFWCSTCIFKNFGIYSLNASDMHASINKRTNKMKSEIKMAAAVEEAGVSTLDASRAPTVIFMLLMI